MKQEQKYLKEWYKAVKKYNESSSTEEQIRNFKRLVRLAPKVGVPEEALLVRVVRQASEAQDE
ncbi:MAG: hypothetical protein JHC30_07245 [Caldisericum sp.]|jgi:hypothetical protein|nr:hypothetical protein [Caldisericum sp.]